MAAPVELSCLLPSEALSLRDVEQGNQELPFLTLAPYAIILFHLDFFILPFVHPHQVHHAKRFIYFLLVFSRTGLENYILLNYYKEKMADVRDKKNFSGKKILSQDKEKEVEFKKKRKQRKKDEVKIWGDCV